MINAEVASFCEIQDKNIHKKKARQGSFIYIALSIHKAQKLHIET
jgi:hypothetical protein